MTMFAEPVLATAAEERMEGGVQCRREYIQGHYMQGGTEHLRTKEAGYPYTEPEDREVWGGI